MVRRPKRDRPLAVAILDSIVEAGVEAGDVEGWLGVDTVVEVLSMDSELLFVISRYG
tara:strand:- start:78 stop:248 length:171 start_codon:yes stop_codon:yes gene_type:complete